MAGRSTANERPGAQHRQRHHYKGHEISSKIIKAPPFSFAHLQLITDSPTYEDLDELTVRAYISVGLNQFLGLTGSAIFMSIDILKVDGRECWIRLPREESHLVIAAIGGWTGEMADMKVGWKVKSAGNWLSILAGKRVTDEIWSG